MVDLKEKLAGVLGVISGEHYPGGHIRSSECGCVFEPVHPVMRRMSPVALAAINDHLRGVDVVDLARTAFAMADKNGDFRPDECRPGIISDDDRAIGARFRIQWFRRVPACGGGLDRRTESLLVKIARPTNFNPDRKEIG